MTKLSRPEALMLTAHLCSREADEIMYRWPHASESERMHAAHLYALDQRISDDAEAAALREGVAVGDAWQRAQEWMHGRRP